MKFYSEYFYFIEDFYNQNQGSHWKYEEDGDIFDSDFDDLLYEYNLQLSSLAYHGYSTTYKGICNALWEMLRIRHKTDYCYKVKYNDPLASEEPLTESQCIDLLKGFVDVFNLTCPRYLPLLKAYQDNDATPLQQMESTSDGKTRFNDTPQNDDLSDGYYSDDGHATNVTAAITTTKTDPAALYEQLDKLFQNWRSIIRDWITEFDGLFIEEVDVL